MRKYSYLVLLIPIAFFIFWISDLEYKRSHAAEVRVAAQGYDPLDLFRGRYIWLAPDWKNTDCARFPSGKCPKEKFKSSYKFYLNEAKAEDLDAVVRSAGPGNVAKDGVSKVEMVFYYDGETPPRLKTLLLDGIDYSEWHSAHSKR